MGADVIFDCLQVYEYYKHGDAVKDLFFASAIIMFVSPALVAFGFSVYQVCTKVDDWFSSGLKDSWKKVTSGDEDDICMCGLGSEFYCVCLAYNFIMVLFLWFFTALFSILLTIVFFIIAFPATVVVMVFAPLLGFVVGFAENERARGIFFIMRYMEGPFEALPQLIINIIFMQRMELATTTNIMKAFLSCCSILQVFYQAFSLKRVFCCCCCDKDTCEMLDGAGPIWDVVEMVE